MHTAPITTTPAEISGLPAAPPSTPNAPSFSDMLASATSSLAAFALLPSSSVAALSSSDHPSSAPKKDPNTDNAAVPISLPAPVQTPAATSDNSSAAAPPPSTPTSSQGAQAPPPASGSGNSTATGGTSNGSAQSSGGVTLPQMAAELGTRIALGAQALLSQPSQALTTLPHGALPAAATPALAPSLAGTAHGAAAPDPAAMLPKLATGAAIAAATPSAAPTTTLEAALQSASQSSATPVATVAAGEAAVLASTSDAAPDSGNAGLGATPTVLAVPMPAGEAAASAETAPPPVVSASALDQVAASLKQIGKTGLSQIEIQLKPAALGAVDVKLELTHDGRVAAVISADRSDTLMQLQRGSGELQQALRDAGLQTDSGSLSFNLRGDAQTSDQSGRQPGYAAPQPAVSGTASDDLLAMPVPMPGASAASHNGLLNIQV
jgi:flagellar hook-length control protein FliK